MEEKKEVVDTQKNFKLFHIHIRCDMRCNQNL